MAVIKKKTQVIKILGYTPPALSPPPPPSPSASPPGSSKPQVDHSKKILLFINPNSGSGRAVQTYRKQVSTLLGEAEVSHEVLVTERASHATDVVRTLDLTKYAGLVILSGDGLLFEVYNGLLARPDWEEAIQFPIGIIPGGSGNGLARSLAHWLRCVFT
ncbi:Sphingosine kinase 1 [Portunus trituberculatus]|uniref:Sphingosine kinase 1 n=1 Tax=Portunus trituberculatus TaxID=210409 RepID=A0A5B7G5H7_PORTR|nr:Sphingosine kinase 1 [Portunus trituberculatus]